MMEAPLEDHVVGLELQLVELVEQRERATVQHRPADAERLQREIDGVQEELARAADLLAGAPEVRPGFHGVSEAQPAA